MVGIRRHLSLGVVLRRVQVTSKADPVPRHQALLFTRPEALRGQPPMNTFTSGAGCGILHRRAAFSCSSTWKPSTAGVPLWRESLPPGSGERPAQTPFRRRAHPRTSPDLPGAIDSLVGRPSPISASARHGPGFDATGETLDETRACDEAFRRLRDCRIARGDQRALEPLAEPGSARSPRSAPKPWRRSASKPCAPSAPTRRPAARSSRWRPRQSAPARTDLSLIAGTTLTLAADALDS